MSKVNELIKRMKDVYEELNLKNFEDMDISELKALRDFSRGYASEIQELIYGFEEMKKKLTQ